MVVPLDIVESASDLEITVTVTVSGFCGSRLTVHPCLDSQPPRDRAGRVDQCSLVRSEPTLDDYTTLLLLFLGWFFHGNSDYWEYTVITAVQDRAHFG